MFRITYIKKNKQNNKVFVLHYKFNPKKYLPVTL